MTHVSTAMGLRSWQRHSTSSPDSKVQAQNPIPTGLRHLFSRLFPDRVLLDFTVAICTYNGEYRLGDVLACLPWQINTEDLVWEVLVIDNNSCDGTAQVVAAFRQTWPRHIPLRYGFEPKQGASFARQRAIEMARSPLVGFLDDDNIPSMTWVAAAHQFSQQYPQAGAYGSRIRGDFEINPPEHFERIAALLALTERGPHPLPYPRTQKVLPPGAGLVVRRQAWLQTVPRTLALAGHIGSRETGEDLEVVLYIQKAGWEIWYNPAMRLYHRIPGNRLKREYLLLLCRNIGLSRYGTRMLSLPAWKRPLMIPLYAGNDLRKIARHLWTYRTTAFTDTVAACELTLYSYSLLSPFYMLWRRLRQKTSCTN
ncbi:EAL domain-containing protein/glycosyl transferase [Halomicronema hongdechloris C2206]|uniref:EAL domain-containing protein/glycosyl transferase n=1 Tax=Halomicronema hongdechloris C2206 TaxID=1641165 RepID=A0A1Z3HTH7_9CYAN|nr:hormogonium polysaccharide biosynthesis glycosyltransferase HpsE [Halomicronema hongdechloris]ASC73566.1 EAL domain-containing protein/glycosyl transferase [Halomicronema hongdechloris C2206]